MGIIIVIILYGYGYSFIVYNSMHPLQEVESYPPLMKNPRLTPFTKKAAFVHFSNTFIYIITPRIKSNLG